MYNAGLEGLCISGTRLYMLHNLRGRIGNVNNDDVFLL